MKTTSTSSSPVAYLAVGRDKNRLKIYGDRKVYLDNGQEFMIELFNPTQQTIGAKILINGNPISQRMLVLKPGEREWLQRHIDDDRKFVFNTYNVEDSKEAKAAIANNGVVTVEFYQESIPTFFNTTGTTTYYPYNNTFTIGTPYYGTVNNCGSGYIGTSGLSGSVGPQGPVGITTSGSVRTLYNSTVNPHEGSACMDSLYEPLSDKVETGRVEAGNASGQSFGTYYGTFNTTAFATETYQILPTSAQPVEANQLRQYCPNCRNRIRKSSWKYCPSCGEDLG